jgi:hypothetical protein
LFKNGHGVFLEVEGRGSHGTVCQGWSFFYEVSLKGEQLDKSRSDYKHYFSLKIGLLRPIFKEKVGV